MVFLFFNVFGSVNPCEGGWITGTAGFKCDYLPCMNAPDESFRNHITALIQLMKINQLEQKEHSLTYETHISRQVIRVPFPSRFMVSVAGWFMGSLCI